MRCGVVNRMDCEACSVGNGGGGESVTFFKASVRLKTGAVTPQIIYSQKMKNTSLKRCWIRTENTACKYLWQPHYTII